MLANRVKETGTGTTGDIALTGTETGFQTFNNALGTDRRFTYFIEDGGGSLWETGVGYLSGSTTLVRERVLDNSAGTFVALTLSGGTHTIIISATAAGIPQSGTGMRAIGGSIKYSTPINLVRMNTTQAYTADRMHYFTILLGAPQIVDRLAVHIASAGGTSANKLHIGFYDVDPATGSAGNLIDSVTDLDPSSTGLKSGTITEISLAAGWYYSAVWCDVGITLDTNDGAIVMPSPFLASSDAGKATGWQYKNSQTGLTDLPAVGNADNWNYLGKLPVFLLGHS